MLHMKNYAFIDGQNLTQNTRNDQQPWKIDLIKFRIFLQEKYHVEKAYYFIGIEEKRFQKLYKFLKYIGFIVVFREHHSNARGIKKTNVDTDIVYAMMKHAYRDRDCDKLILVSNDGDYKKVVSCLIHDRKFRAIMFPGKNWSALYRQIDEKFKVRLYETTIKQRIILK